MVKIKHLILGIAIALISVFFFAYAIQAVYPAPKYEDFCLKQFYENKSICEEAGGEWNYPNEDVYVSEGKEPIPSPERGYCINLKCDEDYRSARESYERNVFFANLIIGIVVLVGAFFLGLEAVSAGLMGGAVLLIVYATIRYWGSLSDIWRTVVLGLSLVILITLAYKKLRD